MRPTGFILLVACCLLPPFGCAVAPTPPPLSTEPLGVQLLRADPSLADGRFAVVLGFESPTDSVFHRGGRIVGYPRAVAHTGGSALAARDAQVTIRLASLLAGKTLPHEWTLLGLYVYADGPARVEASYVVDGTVRSTGRRSVPARQWTPVHVDLVEVPDGPPGDLVLHFDGPVRWIDDVVLIDNARTLVAAEAPPARWTIERKGTKIVTTWPGGRAQRWGASTDLSTAPDGGYVVQEANALRLILTRPGGQVVALYSDGRAFADGAPVAPPTDLPPEQRAAYNAGHARPADVEVAEPTGALDRLSTGDANNDGYNETTGVYTVTARGPRVDLRLVPPASGLVRPILQLANLPPGQVSATAEGKWVETLRTTDGLVLLEVPLFIERPLTISVGVK